MLTKPTALLLYYHLGKASRAWLVSRDGRRLVAQAARRIKAREGRDEARHFCNLMRAAEAVC